MRDKQKALTPKLRFPEFEKNGPWSSCPLERLAQRVTTRNSDGAHTRVLTNSAEHGVLDQRDYFDREIASAGSIDTYYVVQRGDFVYNPRTSMIAPVGPISRNNLGTGVMSPLYTVFRFADDQIDFYEHYFKSAAWHSYLRQVSSTGARHDRMSITTSVFMQMPIPTPDHGERRKIAACLTSLDEWIAAEGLKLEMLRAHKKGMAQQLFPCEGEARPRLRFPEFRNAPEWEVRPLGTLLSRPPEYGVNAPAVAYSSDLPTYIRITDIDDRGNFLPENKASVDIDATDDRYLADGDIVLARTGATVGKSYRFRPEDGRLVFAGFLIRVRPEKSQLDSVFLGGFLATRQYWDWVRMTSTRSGQPGINGTEYASLPVPLPPRKDGDGRLAEQQRIAACLSSVDSLIAVQSRKVDGLRAHKKGLMQQLFPSPEAM